MKIIHASGKKYDISLNTFGESYQLQSHSMRGLQISYIDRTDIVNLSTVYTKDRMQCLLALTTSEKMKKYQDDNTYQT